jgi:Flp pilus assembly protein TadB
MESVNTLRILLVAGAALAGVGALVVHQWVAGTVLLVAVIPHAWLSWYLHRQRRTSGSPER